MSARPNAAVVVQEFDPENAPGELPPGVICHDRGMREIWELVRRVAVTESTVLISGPSGTGKELVAKTLHRCSKRGDGRFVAINCAAIPPDLIESELFGHERGAFTGATAQKIGKFEYANRGTVFLDEISTLGIDLQAKLLRVLQEREMTRVGGLESVPVDLRLVAATNVELRELVAQGAFREDLYYRLNVIPLVLPALSERPDDIVPLARHVLDRLSKRLDRPGLEFDLEAEAALRSYQWRGNVRELENAIERAAVLARQRLIGWSDLPPEVRAPLCIEAQTRQNGAMREARDAFERWLICRTLEQVNWKRQEAAERLGVHRNTLLQKMDGLGIGKCDKRRCPHTSRG